MERVCLFTVCVCVCVVLQEHDKVPAVKGRRESEEREGRKDKSEKEAQREDRKPGENRMRERWRRDRFR